MAGTVLVSTNGPELHVLNADTAVTVNLFSSLLTCRAVSICDSDTLIMMATGIAPTMQLCVYHTLNGGTSWILGNTLATPAPTRVYYARGAKMYPQYGYGFFIDGIAQLNVAANTYYPLNMTLLSASLPAAGLDLLDIHFTSQTTIIALMAPTGGSGDALVYRGSVINGLAPSVSWVLDYTSAVIAGWSTGEYPRRITISPDGSTVYLLSSHALYKRVGGVWSAVWSTIQADVAAAWTGYEFDDADVLGQGLRPFDDLKVDWATDSVFLSGGGGLYASSLSGGPYTVGPCVTDPVAATLIHTDLALQSPNLYKASSRYSGAGCSHSVYKSTNNGVSFGASPWYDYDGFTEVIGEPIAIAAREDFAVVGCTNPDACEYDSSATIDDGSCTRAVTLTNCESADTLVSSDPEISYLAPREGAFQFYVVIDPMFVTQGLTIMVGGSFLYGYIGNISNALTTQQRLDQFLGEFIAGFNAAATGWTAIRTPAAFNTLLPGNANGLTLVCSTNANNGASVSVFGANMTAFADTVVDGGQVGSTIKLNEQPGCWTITGPGSCGSVVALTLQANYEDCFRCVPYAPPLVCRDCDSMVKVNDTYIGSALEESKATCVKAGDVVTFDLLVGFPVVEQQTLTPDETGTSCSGTCPITLHFTGDQTLLFQLGSTFTITPDGNEYTVATATYDSGADKTTVTTVEDCAETSPIDTVNTNTGCDCSVHVTVEELVDETMAYDETFACVDGYVATTDTWTVPREGRYLITIVANYCGRSRTCTYYLNACGEYVFAETDCHKFDITLSRPVAASNPEDIIHTISIIDLADGAVLVDAVQVTEDLLPYEFTSPGDGVYKVTIGNDITTITTVGYIFDMCDTRACRKTMITDLFCSCDDPCDKATCVESAERDERRYLLQRVMLMWSELEAAMFTYRYQFLGIPTYSASREEQVSDIAMLIVRLREVANECGVCADTTTPNSDCTTCQ